MKRFLAITTIFIGFLGAFHFFSSSSPQATWGGLEKGPQPRPALRREAALATLSLSNIIQVALPKSLVSKGVRVLFTAREQDEQRANFSDHENINEAANALNQIHSKFSSREENGRMEAVDFLVQSLTQSENPDYTIGAIAGVILSDSLYQTQDLDYRKSLVGDRVELYQALALTHPEVAKGVFQRAQGTSLSKVLRFAKGRADFNSRIALGH